MTKIRIGELRDNQSQYIRRAEKGETIVIINRTREVAVLSPWRPETRRATHIVGYMKGTARVTGNIIAPRPYTSGSRSATSD